MSMKVLRTIVQESVCDCVRICVCVSFLQWVSLCCIKIHQGPAKITLWTADLLACLVIDTYTALSCPLLSKRLHSHTLKRASSSIDHLKYWISTVDARDPPSSPSFYSSCCFVHIFDESSWHLSVENMVLSSFTLANKAKDEHLGDYITHFLTIPRYRVNHCQLSWNQAWLKRLLMSGCYVFHKIAWKLNAVGDWMTRKSKSQQSRKSPDPAFTDNQFALSKERLTRLSCFSGSCLC